MPYVIELEEGIYFSLGDGDPARTTLISNAKLFRSRGAAFAGLAQAREYRPFPAAVLVLVKLRIERL